MKVVIDGYNLLPETGLNEREELIASLVSYRKAKGHDLTVVFDGTHGGTGQLNRETTGSVKVIYTPLTVQADDYIEEILAKEGGQNLIVISSDRRIQKAAKKFRSYWAYSHEFAKKLRNSASQQGQEGLPPWLEGREEVYEVPKKGTRKKGRARKPSLDERRRLKKLDLL